MGALYQIAFPNGKRYIGITSKTAEHRFVRHVYDSHRNDGVAVRRAIRKYGHVNCRVSTLVVANDWEYLKYIERKAITAFGTMLPNGYNTTAGGDGMLGHVPTAEHRAAIALAIKGMEKSDAAKRKQSIAMTGRVHSDEVKAKIGAANRGRVLSAQSRQKISAKKIGVPRSEETKVKCSVSLMGRKLSDETRAKMTAAGILRRGIPMPEERKAKISATKRKNKMVQQ